MSVDSIGKNDLTQKAISQDGVVPSRPMVAATRQNSVAGHYLSAQASNRTLEAGGNAIDAAVAAGLVLAVVQSDVVNFAGVAPMLIYSAEAGKVFSLAGLGTWPRRVQPDHFVRHHGGVIPHGVERTVVPAAPDAWITALGRFGTMSFGEVASEAIRLARDGFLMYPLMSNIIGAFESEYRRWPSNEAIYLPKGRPPQPGELFVQSDLAATIGYMADQERASGGSRLNGLEAARSAFYCGDIAEKIVRYHAEHGGLLSREDLAEFRTPVEAPVSAGFHQYQMFTCPAWCQGPALIEILRIADALGVSKCGHNSPDYIHLMVEAFKLAFADRHCHFGDPACIDVPLEHLLSVEHAQAKAKKVTLERAWRDSQASAADSRVALDTSYVCVVDKEGNAVSATPSDVSMDTPVIPGLGICPSSRGSQSWADPSHPSSVAPGKRPRLTPSPALAITSDGRLMPFGTPGGDVQLQSMAQVFLNIMAFGQAPQAAVDQPRFATYDFEDSFEPHSRLPGRVNLEAELMHCADDLRQRGHDVRPWPTRTWRAGSVCILDYNPATGISFAGADPRRQSYAIGT